MLEVYKSLKRSQAVQSNFDKTGAVIALEYLESRRIRHDIVSKDAEHIICCMSN